MTFKEYKGRELTESDYKHLMKLQNNRAFERFREIMEDFQMRRAYNLISGHVSSDGMEHEKVLRSNELLKYCGAFDIWRDGFALVDKAGESLRVLKEEELAKKDETES